jgi:hypothetical protein
MPKVSDGFSWCQSKGREKSRESAGFRTKLTKFPFLVRIISGFSKRETTGRLIPGFHLFKTQIHGLMQSYK